MNVKKLLNILLRPTIARALISKRVAAGVEHIPVLKLIAARTVVDIGANKGQFAFASRFAFPEANIFSFEPLPGPLEVLREMFTGDARAVVFQAAIGAERSSAQMNLSAREDSSSLLPISSLQSALFPGTQHAGQVEVKIDRLDAFIDSAQLASPALLKIDVQGYELEVLRGCETLLEKFDAIYVECSFVELYEGQALANEVISWLQQRSFRLTGLHNPAYDSAGRAVQADFLFSRL